MNKDLKNEDLAEIKNKIEILKKADTIIPKQYL
jgi:hypothetical protein